MAATPITGTKVKAVAFGRKLKAEMVRCDNVSSRELGRRVAAQTGITAGAARRNVMRYLAGDNYPSKENRVALADALGVSRELFGDEDDEEDSRLAADLLSVVRRVFEAEKRRAAPLAIALGLLIPAAASVASIAPQVDDGGSLGQCRQGQYQLVETSLGWYECTGPAYGPWFWRFTAK